MVARVRFGSEIRPYGYSPPRRSARTPVQSANRLARQSREGALEHPVAPTAQEEEPWNTPAPAGASYLANPGTFAVAIRRPGGPRSKQPTNAVRCQAYPIYPHVTSGRRRPANLRRPNDRLPVYHLEPQPPRHTRTFHFRAAACVFPIFSLPCGSVHHLPSTSPAQDQHLASSRLRDRTRHLAPGNLLEHTDHQPQALQETSPRSSSSLRSPPRATLSPSPHPDLARPRRPDSISMAHLRIS